MDGRPYLRAVRPEARARLFCFGYAGGGTVDFRSWTDALLPGIDLCPVVLPGRETRLGEPAFDEMHALVRDLVPVLAPVAAAAPYAVYGHSMGAWVAFEWARAHRQARRPLPVHFFAGARRAPHRPGRLAPISHLPEGAFVDAVQQRYGGIPEAIRANPEMMRLFLPTLRADFALLDGYRYRDEEPVALPVTVFAGEDDPVEDPADLRAWSDVFSGTFTLRRVPGGHFFLRDAVDEVAEKINAALRPFCTN
jgi:medium-chain acyl-[acyl-carrier-protein] hydrolase